MPAPEGTKFNAGTVVAGVESLLAELAPDQNKWAERMFSAELFTEYVHRVRILLKLSPKCQPDLQTALLAFYGKTMNAEVWTGCAVRAVALRPAVLRGEIKGLLPPVVTKPDEPLWSTLSVEECRPHHRSRVGNLLVETTLLILEGPYAGFRFTQEMPYKYARYVLTAQLGLRTMKLTRVEEVTGCRLAGSVAKTVLEGFHLDEIEPKPSMGGYNRELVKKRRAVDDWRTGYHDDYAKKWKCGYGRAGPCSACPRGRDVCSRGVHARTYVKASCPGTHHGRTPESWFDPGLGDKLCVACRLAKLYEPPKRPEA